MDSQRSQSSEYKGGQNSGTPRSYRGGQEESKNASYYDDQQDYELLSSDQIEQDRLRT